MCTVLIVFNPNVVVPNIFVYEDRGTAIWIAKMLFTGTTSAKFDSRQEENAKQIEYYVGNLLVGIVKEVKITTNQDVKRKMKCEKM